jgi:hypothetical protein
MEGKFKLEQIWRWHHKDVADDFLLYFPESEVPQEVEIAEILDPAPASAISLDDVEWLLLYYKRVDRKMGDFTLFIRGYQDPGDQITVDNERKIRDLDLLRYEPPMGFDVGDTVWELARVKDLDSMSGYYESVWQQRAVLVIRKGDSSGEHKLQLLCPEPYAPAGYCQAYCCPPKDSKHRKLCRKRKCPPPPC